MMDTAKLLAELDASDAICAAATAPPWTASHRHCDCDTSDDEASGLGLEIDGPPEPMLRGQYSRSGDALFVEHSRTELPARNQQLREALARIADLEAVVVPLERLVKAGFVNCFATKKNYAVGFNLLDAKGVTVYRDTLAEALAAAVKVMEDAT